MPPVRKCWWVRRIGSVGYSPGPEGGFGKGQEISTAIPGSPARLELAFLRTEPPPDPASEASPTSKVSDGLLSCKGLFSSGPGIGIWSHTHTHTPTPCSQAISRILCVGLCSLHLLCRPEKPWLCLHVFQLLKVLPFIPVAFLILLEAPYKKLPSSHE